MENPQENKQALLYQFKYLKDQRDMFANQLEFVNVSLNNFRNTKETIENLKTVKEGEEILIPIGGLINIYATIKNPKKIQLYISQDVVIEKDLDNSIEFVDKIIGQHNEQLQFLRTQIQNLDLNLQNMSMAFQRSGFQQR
ncbi:MAG: prefoldin subunit alpha [Promethearchaeota archaeon]|nr:MAG: prefoldin subunit alpha [Candidatus Lokiarchaeota archaeon]